MASNARMRRLILRLAEEADIDRMIESILAESGQRGRDEVARCTACGNPLTLCGCGESWCADCVPDEPAGTETGDADG